MQFNKIIHDAVVSADLSDKKTVKQLEPITQKIQVAIDSGLDRPYLEGQSMWLGSALQYFESQKLRPRVEIPVSDWMPSQAESLNGLRISTYPDKILLQKGNENKVAAQSTNIHEAVIAPTGNRAAFFRKTDDGSKAEVWVINLKNLKRKKVASLPSCVTILFSMDGGRLFMQEKPQSQIEESAVWSVSTGGGSLKQIGTARVLETIVGRGKYKGALVVLKRTPHHLGTTQEDCAYAWGVSGKEIGRLKDGPCR